MKFKISAPGTIANLGPGFDILGVCLDGIADTFTFTEAAHFHISAKGRDAELVPTVPSKNAICIASDAYFKNLNLEPKAYRVDLNRELPLSGGLGSSAAASVAGALAGAILAGHDSKNPKIRKNVLHAALAGEGAVAGRHLDNIAPCLLGGLTLVQDVEQCQVYSIPFKAEIWLTLATPGIKIRTKDARLALDSSLATERWTKQMSHCTTLALALALPDYEALRFGLMDPFAEPKRGKFIPKFFEAKEAALASGALGFSLSGSGPTCFAVTTSLDMASAVERSLREVWGPGIDTLVCKPSLEGAKVTHV
jgi:homoserine kinase